MQFYLHLLLLSPSLTTRAATPSWAFSLPYSLHICIQILPFLSGKAQERWKWMPEVHLAEIPLQPRLRWAGDCGGAPCPWEWAASVPGSPTASSLVPIAHLALLSPEEARGFQKLFCSWKRLHPYLFCNNLATATHSRIPPFTGFVMPHVWHSQVSNCAFHWRLGCFNNRLLQCSALRKGKE